MQEVLSFFSLLLKSNAVNFIIMIVLLAWLIKKANLATALDKSIEKIKESIKTSEDVKTEAQKLFDSEKKLIDRLPNDLKDLERNAKDKVKVFEKTIIGNTQKSIKNIESSVDRAIEVEEDKISNLMKDATALSSIEVAKDYLQNLLNSNPELHNQFIQNSLEELDKVKI